MWCDAEVLIPIIINKIYSSFYCLGTKVRKTTMPGGHTCCTVQHNHGLNIGLRSKTALNAAIRNKGKVSLCCGMDRLIVCYCMGQSSAWVSAGTRQLAGCAINTSKRIHKKLAGPSCWPHWNLWVIISVEEVFYGAMFALINLQQFRWKVIYNIHYLLLPSCIMWSDRAMSTVVNMLQV
jgi:hypothetical protein